MNITDDMVSDFKLGFHGSTLNDDQVRRGLEKVFANRGLYDATAPMADGGDTPMTASEEVLAWLLIEKIGVPDDVAYTPDMAQQIITARIGEQEKTKGGAVTCSDGHVPAVSLGAELGKVMAMAEAGFKLAEFASYAEIVGALSKNRQQVRDACDDLFRLNGELDRDLDAADAPMFSGDALWDNAVARFRSVAALPQTSSSDLHPATQDLLDALNKIVNNWSDLHPKDRAQARAAIAKVAAASAPPDMVGI